MKIEFCVFEFFAKTSKEKSPLLQWVNHFLKNLFQPSSITYSAIFLDHIDLFDARNICDRQLLQITLKLLVICGGGLVNNLLLSASGALKMR